jgi:hypothetical protein
MGPEIHIRQTIEFRKQSENCPRTKISNKFESKVFRHFRQFHHFTDENFNAKIKTKLSQPRIPFSNHFFSTSKSNHNS